MRSGRPLDLRLTMMQMRKPATRCGYLTIGERTRLSPDSGSKPASRLVKRYRRKLQEALPDTVDLLGIVLGTGLALDQAMMRVSEEMEYIYPELAGEFATVVMQVRAGQERTTAFQQFVRRTGVEDIKSLAAMIVQSEKFGTSLAQALKVYADALRTRRRLRAEAAVAKAGIKMLFPIVVFILPVLFVITLVPGMLSVLKDLKILGAPR